MLFCVSCGEEQSIRSLDDIRANTETENKNSSDQNRRNPKDREKNVDEPTNPNFALFVGDYSRAIDDLFAFYYLYDFSDVERRLVLRAVDRLYKEFSSEVYKEVLQNKLNELLYYVEQAKRRELTDMDKLLITDMLIELFFYGENSSCPSELDSLCMLVLI